MRVEGREITLRPIAGTRRRGATEAEDRALERELLADPKERAEHVMLVDLGRNDVGRVAEIGSVEVTELMMVERYSHVMHIVSNVRGRAARGMDAFDAFRATFPRARCRARRKSARWRSSTNSSRCAAASTPARSATSAIPATSTPRSRCAPSWSRTAASISRPAAAWSPTPTRPPSTRNRSTRRARWSGRSARRAPSRPPLRSK